MPKEPNLAMFSCESCGNHSQADARMAKHMFPWKRKLPIESNGTCKSCGGNSWTISVFFAESGLDVEQSAMGLAMGAVTGIGYVQTSTSISQTSYPSISAEVVAHLNEHPAERMTRITKFAREIERERLKQHGAQECGTCGTLFVEAPYKPWTANGYCSKICAVESEGAMATSTMDRADDSELHFSTTIHVVCPAGHQFDVPLSFRGLPRKCPECGTKTIIPNGDG